MNISRKAILLAGILLLTAAPLAAQKRQTRQTLEEYVDRYKSIAVEHMERYGIPASITELAKRYGKEVSRSDIPTMVANAQKDACGLTNPRKMTDAAVQQLYEIAF